MSDPTGRLDAIEARTTEDRKDFIEGGYLAESDVCISDREALLDLARKQQAALDAVRELAEAAAPMQGVGGWYSGIVLADKLLVALETTA